MTTTAWIALLLAWSVSVAAPGPDFVAVLRSGAAYGRRDALTVGAGIVTGIAMWIVLAITGLSVVIAAHAGVHTALRIIGATFLAGYGAVILWHNHQAARAAKAEHDSLAGDLELQPRERRSAWAAYRLGLITNVANPKALLFFGALLASLLPASPSVGTKVMVTVSMLTIATAWFAFTATMAGSPMVVRAYQRARRGIDAALGSIFIGLGGLLLAH